MIKVLVVEDQRALADALELAIGSQPDLECVGAVGTVEAALPLAAAGADTVLMDVHLPGINGIEGTAALKAAHPEARVLILTADPDPAVLAAATAAGAAGFLSKDSRLPDILAALRAPAGGPLLVEGTALVALLGPAGGGRETRGPVPPVRLTARELQVLRLLGDGLGPQAIAERLVISRHTARGHVKKVLMKLGAHSQLEAVVAATRTGLLPADPENHPI
ncbi:response regulator transcription factor [Streptomyces sclerotialus]|uniref:response regulator transcription factor n=1 Tax=Streptomyces sclerotialus TaxID=1957 RepID=UPI0004C5EB87